MATRFRKSIKVAPGVRLNFGKQSASVTVGPRGSSISFGSRGTYANVGLRGTGLSYRQRLDTGSKVSAPVSAPQQLSDTQIAVTLALQPDGSITFTDKSGAPLPEELTKEGKRQQKQYITESLQENCDEINAQIEPLLTIHLNTPAPNTPIHFEAESFPTPKPSPPKFDPVAKPLAPEFEKAGAMAKVFGPLRRKIEARNAAREREYQESLHLWQEEEAAARKLHNERYVVYQQELDDWADSQRRFDEQQVERRKFIEQDRLKDPTAMGQFLAEMFESIIWPRETPIGFEVSSEGERVKLEVPLPPLGSYQSEDWPSRIAKVNKRDLRLTYSEKSDTQKRLDYVTHVHSILFRIVGEVFFALPTVKTVIVTGLTDIDDPQTGNQQQTTVFDATVDREIWSTLNFDAIEKIDVVQCFDIFETHRNITKTGIIRPL